MKKRKFHGFTENKFDSASSHTSGGVEDTLNRHGSTVGWNIKMVQQPAQCPDLNINDLSFFHSLKACQIDQKWG